MLYVVVQIAFAGGGGSDGVCEVTSTLLKDWLV